jgi:hypothetical protein
LGRAGCGGGGGGGRFVTRLLRRLANFSLRLALPECHLRAHQKTRQIVLRNVHHFAAAQTAIALGIFVETVGIGERVTAPGQQTQPLSNSLKQHGWLLKAWQIGVSSEVLG